MQRINQMLEYLKLSSLDGISNSCWANFAIECINHDSTNVSECDTFCGEFKVVCYNLSKFKDMFFF